MHVYTAIASKVLFPLHEWAKGQRSVAARRELDRVQWWPRERIEALQLERLQNLLRDAHEHVPYYRAALDACSVQPADLRSLDDLRRVPLLSKELIRRHVQDLHADDAGALIRHNTGGSTGEPLVFYMSKARVSRNVAAKWRSIQWWGLDIGDPEIVVWGSPIELGAQDRVRGLRDRMFRSRLLPAFEMSEAKLDGFVVQIRALRPRMLFGYPSALAHVALHAERKRARMDDLGIEVAFVTGEKCLDHQKDAIANVFGCRVSNEYGGRDVGIVAHECPAGGLHIVAENLIVEILDASGRPMPPGSAGEVVITQLHSRDFPFIRYRTGDVATLSSRACPCGRGLPLLEDVHGRSTDFVVAQDGTVMHGLALIYVVRDHEGVRQFKIVQESLALTRILLAVDQRFDRRLVDEIRRQTVQRLGAGVDVQVQIVADIPAERSGKFRHVVSHVTRGNHGSAPAAGGAGAPAQATDAAA
jgi:phenylacetate-CoA ligase